MTNDQIRSIVVDQHGGREVLRLDTTPPAAPGPGQALVRVEAAGVSYGDVLLRNGVIPFGPKRPFVPGFDVTGRVEAVGAGVTGVTGVAVGDRVCALIRQGGYADLVAVPAERLVPVPESLDAVQVAAAALNYFIAHQMLHRVARLERGGRVLLHGAAGGVGTAVLQLAALAGIEVYGTCSAGKRDVVTELGGTAIDYRSEDFVEVIRSLPGGTVDAALDPVGGLHFRRSLKVVRRGGVMIGFGQSDALVDGKVKPLVGIGGLLGGIVAPKLVPNGKRTLFYNAWSLEKKVPQAYAEDLATVVSLLERGRIAPLLSEVIPLGEAARAHELLENSAVRGKLVLSTAVRPVAVG